MIYLYVALGIVTALTVAAVFLPLGVDVAFSGNKLKLQIVLWKIKFNISKRTKPKKQKRTNKKNADTREMKAYEKIKSIYQKAQYIKNVYTASSPRIAKNIFAENVSCDITFGTSDAALTGMLTGIVWAVGYEILGIMTLLCTVKEHHFDVDSVYDRYVFEINARINMRTNIAGLLCIAVSVLYNLMKYKRIKE